MLSPRFKSKPAPEKPRLNGAPQFGGRLNSKLVRPGTLPDVTYVSVACEQAHTGTFPSPLPSWVNYYQMLLFAQKQYDFIVVDLPEVVNPATAELLSVAQRIFIGL